MSKTRILESVRKLDFQTTRELLQRRPELSQVEGADGRNLLHIACSASCPSRGVPEAAAAKVVRLLLESGIDVDSTLVRDDYPCNPVWFAVARGRNRTVVRLLLSKGATPTGLFAAGWNDDVGMLRLLLRGGASINERAEDETPFLHCWKTRRLDAARFLLRNGADVNFQDSKGKTALHYGIERSYEPELLKFLASNGASPDIEDRKGVSARTKAARKRDKRYAKIFE